MTLEELAGQDPANLDMTFVGKWCAEHGTTERLQSILDSLPEF